MDDHSITLRRMEARRFATFALLRILEQPCPDRISRKRLENLISLCDSDDADDISIDLRDAILIISMAYPDGSGAFTPSLRVDEVRDLARKSKAHIDPSLPDAPEKRFSASIILADCETTEDEKISFPCIFFREAMINIC